MSDEYWIISVPAKKAPQKCFEEVDSATKREQLSDNSIFSIPDLKVGTLDSLVAISDDLGRFDSYVEGVIKKNVQFFFNDVLEGDRNRFAENLVVGQNSINPRTYVMNFSWDHAKYPTKQPLKNLLEIMTKSVTHIESELKLRGQSYTSVKQNLESLTKKQTGSLLTRNLNDLVKKEHFVLGSEYLKTLLVCVPKGSVTDWYNKYERLCDKIVPRSSELIIEDQDYALFTVTLFQRTEDVFRVKCRENRQVYTIVNPFEKQPSLMKFVIFLEIQNSIEAVAVIDKTFVVRDFTYDEQMIGKDKEKMTELETERQKLFATLVRWLRVNFSEIFSTWIHVKALRVFVESVLRFGLPVDFVAMTIHPTKKSNKRLRDTLDNLFRYLDTSAGLKHDDEIEIPGIFPSQQEYYPYVYFKLDLEYLDMTKK